MSIEHASTMRKDPTVDVVHPFLRPVVLKLLHADQLGKTLAQSISDWTSQNQLNVRHEFLDERLGYRLILGDFAEPPALDEWGLMAGDFAHNVRSALDNLAFALAKQHQDPPLRPRDVAFPIYIDEARFDRNGRQRINQLPRPAAELIEKLQPFQRDGSPERGSADRDPLVLLQWLNNADKHTIPLLALVAPTEFRHSGGVEYASDEDAAANVPPDQTVWGGPLAPGVVLLEHRSNRPIKAIVGQFEGQAIVALETPNEHVPVGATLRDLGTYVWQLIGLFQQFFD